MFTVLWLASARIELLVIWEEAEPELEEAIKVAVSAIGSAIGEQLAGDPAQVGESRDNNERIMFAPPLGLRFKVDIASREVRIVSVWRIRRRDQE